VTVKTNREREKKNKREEDQGFDWPNLLSRAAVGVTTSVG